MSTTSDITSSLPRDLESLCRDLSPKQMRSAWRSSLRKAAKRVLKAARAEAATSFGGRGEEMAEEGVQLYLPKNLMGFSVLVIPSKKANTAHKTRWGKWRPIVMWADTGIKKDTHGWKQDKPARHFMAAIGSHELPQAVSAIGADVEKRIQRQIQKRIKSSYGRR